MELDNVEKTSEDTATKMVANILNKLCADEWIAYCQYILGIQAAKGKQLNFLSKVFKESAEDELDHHFYTLVGWMQSNNMAPELDYEAMNKLAGTPFKVIKDGTSTAELLSIAIQAEQEAIAAYTAAMEVPEVKNYPDLVVVLGEILADERGHLKELQDVQSAMSKDADVMNFSARIKKALRKNFSEITEEDKKKILEYADTLATEIFGDDKDSEKVNGVADNAIEMAETLDQAMGIVKNSYTNFTKEVK